MFEQGVLHFYFALRPTNYTLSSDWVNITSLFSHLSNREDTIFDHVSRHKGLEQPIAYQVNMRLLSLLFNTFQEVVPISDYTFNLPDFIHSFIHAFV